MRASPTAGTRRFGRRRDDSVTAALAALAEAVQVRDGATAQHSVTVGRLCSATAAELGLDADHAAEVEIAGVLHDLGKVGLPDAILHKPGPLTEEEWRAVQQHPAVGAQIVAAGGLADVSQWILLHHERPDAKGYPHGLSRESIPLEAAIVSVADAFEAMIADRVYRPALDEAEARSELEQCAGTQFDARVVEAFLRATPRALPPPLP
jgi:HD-GYP domain-containing protein (c-di-GMP phosphodiesterase class II)